MIDIERLWEKAKDKTEILRGRVKALSSFSLTAVPYIFLAESIVNEGNTVVRKGKILVEQPLVILPENSPQFEGFDLEEELGVSRASLQTFFFMRGIKFPSLKYDNKLQDLELEERSLGAAAERYKKLLESQEDVVTALVLGPEDCWQFSLLIYVAMLVARCAPSDIMNMIKKAKSGKGL